MCCIRHRACYMQALALSFWSLSTLRYDSPDTYEALAERTLQLMEDPRAREEIQEQVMTHYLPIPPFPCSLQHRVTGCPWSL